MVLRKVSLVVLAMGWIVLLTGSATAQSLAITAVTVSDFQPVSLSGTATTTTASMSDFSVTDSREAGEGWNVVVQGTLFAQWDGAGYVSGGASLPAGSLTMHVPSVSSAEPSPSPPSLALGPYRIDGYATKIASAAVGEGVGTYTFMQTGPLTLSIPAAAYAGLYRSEITISVASGP